MMSAPARRRTDGPTQRWLSTWGRNPIAEFDELLNQMGGLFDTTIGLPPRSGAVWTPPADVTETDEAFHVEVELPGVRRQDIDVEVNGRELAISGEAKEGERHGTLRHGTRRTGHFEYRVALPGEVNPDGVKAGMSDGILTVTIPRAEAARRRRVEISDGGR